MQGFQKTTKLFLLGKILLEKVRWFEVLAAKGATVSDTNHYPHIDHSDEFDAQVIAFLTGALDGRCEKSQLMTGRN